MHTFVKKDHEFITARYILVFRALCAYHIRKRNGLNALYHPPPGLLSSLLSASF